MSENPSEERITAARIIITGTVQGVGFRPFIYNLARRLSLRGQVRNADCGVVIEVTGDNVALLIDSLRKEVPPLARIDSIEVLPLESESSADDFIISQSEHRGGFTMLSPDIATCGDCLRELMDGNDRRYLYPFINCTNCGPRYTITESIPYDRKNTTMRAFRMCPDCEREYLDPGDRRFHAQPNACPVCGPKLGLRPTGVKAQRRGGEDPLKGAIRILQEGCIVAIKGLGGYHIACDAQNNSAVRRLRKRKRKSNKPFAVMAADVSTVESLCLMSSSERTALLSHRKPIVLMRKRDEGTLTLADSVAPGNAYLGCMMPYTPLHHLLFHHPDAADRPLRCLVMTSGNLAEEPIVTDNDDAMEKLSSIVDCFLVHDRDIYMPLDDSVTSFVSVSGGGEPSGECMIRRARGYTPEPIMLHSDGPEVIGCGADLKNTFTLLKGRVAVMSQHLGDMENMESLAFFEKTLANLAALYRVTPVAAGFDMHPNYSSSLWAQNLRGVTLFPVQHHHAHVASVMALHGIEFPLVGVVLDGTGFGLDGHLWGGEFFVGTQGELRRGAHFRYVPLAGGEASVRNPWMTAISYLREALRGEAWTALERLGFGERFEEQSLKNVMALLEHGEFCPLSSGAGRLFDAVSSIIGICDVNSFEAEAPMRLEAIVDRSICAQYGYEIITGDPAMIDFCETILSIIRDYVGGVSAGVISAKFHNTIAAVIREVTMRIAAEAHTKKVLLSGGVFQNRTLLSRATSLLLAEGMHVYVNDTIPCNDACVSLGQAFLVRRRIAKT